MKLLRAIHDKIYEKSKRGEKGFWGFQNRIVTISSIVLLGEFGE